MDIETIKRLRELTGVGITDAKQALVDSKGDFEKALTEMRKKGLTKAEKRSEHEARAGLIGSYIHDGRIGVLLEVNCETDFVARTELFKNLVKDLAMHVAASSPVYVSENQVPKEKIKKIELELTEQAKNETKSAEVLPKVVAGKLKKQLSEQCLLSQPFIKNPDQKVEDYIKEYIAKLGENIIVKRFKRMALGEVE